MFERFIEPKLADSYGSKGCSPHESVDSNMPIEGVGLSLFILSRKIIPGSPVLLDVSHINSKIFS